MQTEASFSFKANSQKCGVEQEGEAQHGRRAAFCSVLRAARSAAQLCSKTAALRAMSRARAGRARSGRRGCGRERPSPAGNPALSRVPPRSGCHQAVAAAPRPQLLRAAASRAPGRAAPSHLGHAGSDVIARRTAHSDVRRAAVRQNARLPVLPRCHFRCGPASRAVSRRRA